MILFTSSVLKVKGLTIYDSEYIITCNYQLNLLLASHVIDNIIMEICIEIPAITKILCSRFMEYKVDHVGKPRTLLSLSVSLARACSSFSFFSSSRCLASTSLCFLRQAFNSFFVIPASS